MAKKSMRAALRQEVADVFRRAILDAAEQVFGTHGFADAKMADIAKRAGLAAGTIYKHFESKEDIFRALLERSGDEFDDALDVQLAGAPLSVPDRLLVLVRAVLTHCEERRATFSLLLELCKGDWSIRRVGGASAEKRYLRYLARFTELIEEGVRTGTIRDDLRPAELAQLLTGGLNGLIHAWLMQGAKNELAGRATLLVDALLHGVGARK
jgi:TetR/AcrR family transcriptional regulator